VPRAFYLAGWGYVLIALFALGRPGSPLAEPPGIALPSFGGPANAWFGRVKPRCNALEVEVTLRSDQPPESTEGAGFGAACWALSGRMDRARSVIEALPPDQRPTAANIVFSVGHPVADAGDDASAGPIMRLVVGYTPWNYMAQYHAGMSYYVLGDHALAREHLSVFLDQYEVDDGWQSNAREVLSRIGGRLP
jgi:hypothetical protein